MPDSYFDEPMPNNAPVTKVCRRCSTQTITNGSYCPNCGASYLRKNRRVSGKLVSIVASVLLVLAAAAIVLIVSNRNQHNHAVALQRSRAAAASSSASSVAEASTRAAAKAAAESSASAASAASESAVYKRLADRAERSKRQEDIKFLERAIKKDAAKDISDGILDGPILRVDCTPLAGGSTDDLTARTGAFTCLAVNKINHADGTESGYGFSAVINWDSGEITWHLGNS